MQSKREREDVVYKPLGYLHQAVLFVLYTEGPGQAVFSMWGMVTAATPAGRELWLARLRRKF